MHISLLRAVLPSLLRVHSFESMHTIVGGSRFFESAVRDSGLAYEAHRVEDEAAARQAFVRIPDKGKDGVVVFPVPVAYPLLAGLAIEHRLVTTGYETGYANAGGLMACNERFPDQLERVAAKVNEILRGGNPAEMPFELPRHTRVVLNGRTAAAIGTSFPADLLLRYRGDRMTGRFADEARGRDGRRTVARSRPGHDSFRVAGKAFDRAGDRA